jgi:hypothetical protein
MNISEKEFMGIYLNDLNQFIEITINKIDILNC